MNRSELYRFFSGILVAAIFCSIAFFQSTTQAYSCGAGKRPLYFFADTSLSVFLPEDFGEKLYSQLLQPLEEIGYCLTTYNPGMAQDTSIQDEQGMHFSMPFTVIKKLISRQAESGDGIPDDSTVKVQMFDTSAQMVVSLVHINMLHTGRRPNAATSPLLTLDYHTDELSTFESVLIRKIIENLRDQYICHLRIESIPEGVLIRSKGGLEGITPLEWIIPVGKITFSGEREGFEPIRRTINLNSPGIHTYMLDMSKRRFYHSRFFIPTLVFGTSSVVCFAVDRYFYNRYRELGRSDRDKQPDPFERNFTTAKNFERAAAGALALTGISLVCSFIF